MNCLICEGRGWLKAAPMSTNSKTHTPAVVALWRSAVLVPCFGCRLRNLAVIA